jgi:CheY-like chemotaxis protein
VEDEQIAGMDIQAMVEEEGYSVVDLVDTGGGALDTLDDESVDLVLLDINLPGELDGIETSEKISENSYDVPYIFLTAYSDESTLDRAKHTNPAGFLIKPVTQADLKASIEMALQ